MMAGATSSACREFFGTSQRSVRRKKKSRASTRCSHSIEKNREPGQFLTKLNCDLYSILKHTGTPLLTTAFYFVANCQTGKLQYANAGHPKPLHLKRSVGQAVPLANSLGKGQAALGLLENTIYQRSEVLLAPGDMIMLFTDGLYEVEGANNEIYSQALLLNGV